MKRFYILTGVMVPAVLAASSFAFNFSGSGGGGKRITTTVNSLIAKGPAWSAAANYSSNTRYSHAVTYGGSTWAAIQNSNNQVPSDGSVYWWKYIAQGPQGPAGAKGDTGTVTASAGLVVAQRQYSSHSVELYQPSSIGSNKVIITADDNITTSPKWKFGDSQITVNDVPYAGSGGGSSFTTKSRSVFTNMSTDKFYIPSGFAKNVLPLAGANKNLYVMAQTSSAHISTNSETGRIRQMGGITSTAGYTVRVPKGSLYWFVAKESGFWEAFKLIGSDITQYVADFVAAFTWSPTSKSFGSVNTGTEVYQMFTATNTGNGSALNSVVAFLNQSSAFRLYSSTCVKAVFKPNSTCRVGVAFKPTVAGTWTGTQLNITADGLGNFMAALTGTGTTAGFSYTDNFNGSINGNWTTITGSNPLSLSSTYVTGSVVSAHNRVYYNSTTANNQYAQIKFAAVANHSGLLLRVNPSGTFYAFLIEDTSVTIKKCTNATTCVDKATFAYSVQSNDVMKFTAVGNLLTGYVNNSEKVNYTDNTSPYTSGYTGLSLYSNVGNADDAAGGDL